MDRGKRYRNETQYVSERFPRQTWMKAGIKVLKPVNVKRFLTGAGLFQTSREHAETTATDFRLHAKPVFSFRWWIRSSSGLFFFLFLQVQNSTLKKQQTLIDEKHRGAPSTSGSTQSWWKGVDMMPGGVWKRSFIA